jgi:cytidylate kinase
MTAPLVIAIDGPAGSGKSTVARAVAERLGCRHLDTGAMYRAVTLLALRSGAVGDGEAAASLARGMKLEVNGDVLLDGDDVTSAIRSPEVDAAVSEVSSHPLVRAELVARQREWAAEAGGAVVEGRDIGSVVFPDARLKVYLTAHPEERARRRAQQLQRAQQYGQSNELLPEGAADTGAVGEAAAALAKRDDLDSSRAVSPLLVPDGAIVMDSTGRAIDDVVEEVLSYL